MVENRSVRKVTVKGKRPWNFLLADPIDQFLAEDGVILERNLKTLAKVFLLKAAEFQGVMFATGADVIDDEIIVSDLVAMIGMVPEPANVRDELAAMVDQGVVNGD